MIYFNLYDIQLILFFSDRTLLKGTFTYAGFVISYQIYGQHNIAPIIHSFSMKDYIR